MPKLFIENGPDRGKSYVVSREGPFFAGRDAAAQVPVRDEMVSRRQFQIEIRDEIFHIRDLESANGTYLNDRRVAELHPLVANDRIQVGQTIITFLDETPHPFIGRELGGYRILHRIGRGGMGTVYRALQLSLDRIVALKILSPHLVENANFINLFIREARAAGAISHPHIVQVYDVGVEDETYFFSMEYIPNGSVEDILNQKGKLTLPRALHIVRDAALGLQYAEQKGIIHRDIKPGNLMVGAGDIIKIGDLGIARRTEGADRVSQKDGVSGSPHYIAPEQARGHDIDHRVDIYSLGVSCYQMLCGKTPFAGSTPREVVLKQIKEEPPSLAERVTELPEDVVRLVERMMAKNPEERFTSATTLLTEVERLRSRFGAPEEELVRTRRGRWALFVVGGALLLAGVTVATVFALDHYLTLKAVEAEKIAALRGRLEALDTTIRRGALDEADLELEQLAREGLPAEVADEYETIRDLVSAGLEERARARKEEQAADGLVSLKEHLATPATADDVEKLRRFATQHAGTDGAREALALADHLTEKIREQTILEREATRKLATVRSAAEGALGEPPDFARALKELMVFPSERYANTRALQDWNELLQELDARVRREWYQEKREIQEMKSVDALFRLRRFLSKVKDFKDVYLEAKVFETEIEGNEKH